MKATWILFQTKNGLDPLPVVFWLFILIYFHADSAADANPLYQNTNGSGTTRKRGAKNASTKVVEKQKRFSTPNENKQIKGIFG